MLEDLDSQERLQLMKFVCSFAWADLRVRPQERVFVARLVAKLKLSAADAEQVQKWLVVPPRAEEVDPTEIPRAHRQLLLSTVRELVAADGESDGLEQENLQLLEQLLAQG